MRLKPPKNLRRDLPFPRVCQYCIYLENFEDDEMLICQRDKGVAFPSDDISNRADSMTTTCDRYRAY